MLLEVWLPASTARVAAAAGAGETFKNIAAGVASIATTVALLIGGVWAWFKFIRGRTFNPRISYEILGQWRPIDDATAYVLHVRVRVTNISAAAITLRQYYTALDVSFLRGRQSELPDIVEWENYLASRTDPSQVGAFAVLEECNWIEPGETVTDDLMLELGRRPAIAKLELSLAWNSSSWRWRRRWRTWRRMHRWVLYPRAFCRNRCRPAYRWGERTRGVRRLCGLIRWRRRCRTKLRRRICRSRLYSWIYRRPDDPTHRKDVADFIRRIITPDSTMIDDDDSVMRVS